MQVEQVSRSGRTVRIAARTAAASAACPGCGTVSRRVHSRYERRLLDTAAGGCEVVICLSVRRFRCLSPDCSKATFAEQVERADQQARAPHPGGDRGAGGGRAGAGRPGRARLSGRLAAGGQPDDADPPGPGDARPRRQRVAAGAGRGRVRAAQGPPLRDAAGRRRDPPARRHPGRAVGGLVRRLAGRPAGSRGDLPGPGRGLLRRRLPAARRRGPGRRPLAPVAQPRRGGRAGGQPAPRAPARRCPGAGPGLSAGRRSRRRRRRRRGPGGWPPGPGTGTPTSTACWPKGRNLGADRPRSRLVPRHGPALRPGPQPRGIAGQRRHREAGQHPRRARRLPARAVELGLHQRRPALGRAPRPRIPRRPDLRPPVPRAFPRNRRRPGTRSRRCRRSGP